LLTSSPVVRSIKPPSGFFRRFETKRSDGIFGERSGGTDGNGCFDRSGAGVCGEGGFLGPILIDGNEVELFKSFAEVKPITIEDFAKIEVVVHR